VLLGVDSHFQQDVASFLKLENITAVNSPAPDFELDSLSGEQVKLSDYLGKPVLVNFWATWCTPCRYEMPLFERYDQNYGQEFIILGVNLQQTGADIREFTDEFNITFPILLDVDGSVNKLYKVQGLPTSVFIDREGLINAVHIGSLSESQLVDYLHQIGLTDD